MSAANVAPFSLTLQGLTPLSAHRWRYEAALDAPYTLTVVLHLSPALAPLLERINLSTPAGLPGSFYLQAQANSWEPLHGSVCRIALGADELAEASAESQGPDVIPCTLTLRPPQWWASLNQTSRSFQRVSVQDTVMQVLGATLGFGATDVEFRLASPPLRRRYRQQYQESDLAFVSRLLEREGWSWFFEQGPERERMVVTDSAAGWTRPPQWTGVRYAADAGMSTFDQAITRFERCFNVVATEHGVDDHNYRAANQSLQAEGGDTRTPFGQIHRYGSHAKTPDEALLRATQQRQRAAQHALRANAHSTLTALAPGNCIGIAHGPARALGRWLVISVTAEGDRQRPYANRFTAQPESTPYQPEWDTPLPDMAGFTHMRIDTTDTANPYARLDPHGRYLAWHYFEHTQSQDGRGSAPLRLARDYAGPTYGQHFPVHAGVEALAGYVHGDPDRPVLLGVVHDSRNPSPVTAKNASRHVLRTWANNKLRLEDQGGQEHIKLSTEYGLSQLNLGHLVNHDCKPRGQGFELRTENEGVLRAEKGWLLSTHGTDVRASEQMHNEPLQEQLKQIRPWAGNRSKAAAQVGLEAASSLKAADKLQQDLAGHKAPMQAFTSPAGIVLSARQDLILGAEQAQGFYAQGPISLTSNEPLGITAKKGLRLHAESGGLKQVVSEGDYTVHVQDGDFELLAKQDVQLESKSGVVRLQTEGGKYFVEIGPKGIRVNAKEVRNLAGVQIDFTGGPVAGQVSASAGQAEGLGYFGKMEVKDAQLGEIKTRYALEQLQGYAQEADGMLFVLSFAAWFGYDIPPSAFTALHEQAKSGALKNPEHELVPGDGVSWNASAKVIEVGQHLAQQAVAGDEQAQWRLLGDLLDAFGKYLDQILRTKFSTTRGQAPGSSENHYLLLLTDLEGQDHTDFGELTGEGGGVLRAKHARLKEAMRQARERSEQLDKERTSVMTEAHYHDGLYRPERDGRALMVPVFDARTRNEPVPKGMFNHGEVEAKAFAKSDQRFSRAEIEMIYYGNWLRDLSQVLDIGILTSAHSTKSWAKSVVNGDGYFPREVLTLMLIALGEMQFTQRLIEANAPAIYLDFIQLNPSREAEYVQRVGTYRPEEHIDNPAGLPQAYPYALPEAWLVPVPIPATSLGVNPRTGLRNYIDTTADAQHPCTVDYICAQLAQAASLGKTPAGLTHFGNALHVLEDFFAHSNFVELALYKLGHVNVITWVPKKLRVEDMPVTTGVFEQQDQAFALLYKLADLIAPLSDDAKRKPEPERLIEGMPVRDWIAARLLDATGQKVLGKVFRNFSRAGVQVKESASQAVPDAVQQTYRWIKQHALSYINGAIKAWAQAHTRRDQMQAFDHEHSIDPTHTLLAKDDTGHPLHQLASALAVEAVADVGRVMQLAWAGKTNVTYVQAAARAYFVHPARSTCFDAQIAQWTQGHPQALQMLSDPAAMTERAKRHSHGAEATEPATGMPHPPPLNQSSWNYLTHHYRELTGSPDALPGRSMA